MTNARHTFGVHPQGALGDQSLLERYRNDMGDVIDIEVVSAIQLPDVERMRGFGGKDSSSFLFDLG